jgi:hypothetical protein
MKKGAAQNAEQAPAAGLLFGDWRDEVFAKTVGEAIGLWGIHLCERMRAERAAELADLRQTIARLEGQLAAMTALLGVKADAFGDLKGEKGEPGPRRTSATRTSLRRFKLRRRCGAPAGADHTGARSRRVSRRHILSVISPS